MLTMSFYNNTLNRKKLIEFIKNTNKEIRYTYGFSFKNPVINNKLITKDEAINIVNNEPLLDATKLEDILFLNAFSGNDMF